MDLAKWWLGPDTAPLVQTASGHDAPSSGLKAVLGDVRAAVGVNQGSLAEDKSTSQWMCAITKVEPHQISQGLPTRKQVTDRDVSDPAWAQLLQVAGASSKSDPILESVQTILRDYGKIALGNNNSLIYVDVGSDKDSRGKVQNSAFTAVEDFMGPAPKGMNYEQAYVRSSKFRKDVSDFSASAGQNLQDLHLLLDPAAYKNNFAVKTGTPPTIVVSQLAPTETSKFGANDELTWTTVHELAHANLFEMEQSKGRAMFYEVPTEITDKLLKVTKNNPNINGNDTAGGAATAVFSESYADSLAVLAVATTRGADKGIDFLEGIYTERLQRGELTTRSVHYDSHDTSGALDMLRTQLKQSDFLEGLSAAGPDAQGNSQSMRLHHQAIETAADSVSSWAEKAGLSKPDALETGAWFKAEYASLEKTLLEKSDLMLQPHPELQVKPMNQDTVSELKGSLAQAICEVKRDAPVEQHEREMGRQRATPN